MDFIQALNQTYFASHAFWTHLAGTESVQWVFSARGDEMVESRGNAGGESFDSYRLSGQLPLRRRAGFRCAGLQAG